MGSSKWARFVGSRLNAKRMNRRELAISAGVDPSYVTLFLRDGYVPKRPVVIRVAKALGADVDEALLVCGYAPDDISFKELLEGVKSARRQRISPPLLKLLGRLPELTTSHQARVAEMLEAYLSTLKRKKASGE